MSKDLIDELGELTYLEVNTEKKKAFSNNFQEIIKHIDQLQDLKEEVDILPYYYTQTLREDVLIPTEERYSKDTKKAIFDEMPKTQDGYLLVKAILKN
jgi:aspartyl/glutamyl-tRNA(Asn/Gln) amidotransferase C subunit